ncbi:MAG TPA: glycosyltransferase, partial [Gemmataceae bacterium]|nr:glycosyltransferase [Gemmataceae bacterium]
LKEDPARHLLIVGDGPELDRLKTLAASLGVSEAVHFLGLRTDVPDLLADADLFVLASRAEGLTLAVVEAMAAELAVVVTDVGGHKEVVTPDTGWIVPPEDVPALRSAVAVALADPPAARARGAAGRRLAVAGFSLTGQVEAQYGLFARAHEASRRGKMPRPSRPGVEAKRRFA